jgi:hypothetical protein
MRINNSVTALREQPAKSRDLQLLNLLMLLTIATVKHTGCVDRTFGLAVVPRYA